MFAGVGSFGNSADAASSRVAIIKELKGTVKVKKAGGAKEFTAFAKMSLNQGDILSTGTGSSAVLQFANGTAEDDKMTVSANTRLTFSKLSDRNGTTTKVSMWSGSAWADVKSITSENDEFKLETPTAVMGVRGTHLLVSVDPTTGDTRLIVAAGVVRTETTGSGDRQVKNVYPTQRALITDADEEQPGDIYVAPVDLSLLMSQSDENIVSAILGSAAEIMDENKRFSDQYTQEGLPEPLGETPADLERFKTNTENLLGAIADQAVKSGLLTQERLDRIVSEVKEQSGLTIDLSKKQLDITEEDKKKQEEQRRLEAEQKKKAEEQRQKELERRSAEEALLKQLEEAKKKQAEANKKAEEEKKKKALETYESGLSDAEKARYEREKKNREAELGVPSPSPSPSPGSNPSTGSPPSRSNVATLSDLKINGASLNGFAANTVSYTYNVSNETAELSVSPFVTSGSNATVKVGDVAVASGSATSVSLAPAGSPTVIEIVVTAENGVDKRTYLITVNREVPAENMPPTDITLSNATIAENSGIGYIVGTLGATDPDSGDTFTYALVPGNGDTDNGSFSISGMNLLTGVPVNYESKNLYNIRVRVTDGGGLTYEKAIEIHISDVDESPTNITIQDLAFFSYTMKSEAIGTLVPTGGEGGITFSFAEGAGDDDNAMFSLNSIDNRILETSAGYDDGLKGTYYIRIKATDSNGSEYEKSLKLTTQTTLLSIVLFSSYNGADSVTSQVYLSDISSGGFIKISGHEYLSVVNTASTGYAFWMRKNPGQLYLNDNGSALVPIGEYYQFGLNLGWNRLVAKLPDGDGIPREYKFYIWAGNTPPTNLALTGITAKDSASHALSPFADGTNPFLWKVNVSDPAATFVDIAAQFADSGTKISKVVLANGQYAEEAGTMLNGYRIPYTGTPTYAYIHIVSADGKPYVYKLIVEPMTS